MHSFYLIDKPTSITSFDIIRKLRKIVWVRKMWHTWTLDPLATWLVLVAVWNYTKLIPYFEKDSKEYEFTIWLDWITDSFDIETPINYISEDKQNYFTKKLTRNYIKKVLDDNFLWEINQLPPKYSALKVWGKKALDLVRSGEDFELKKRKVTIKNIEILDFAYPNLKLRAKVSAWTYIRSIAFDLWEIIWCGWYIKELRRTKIWFLDLEQSQKLEDFKVEKKLNCLALFKQKVFIELSDENLEKINNWLQIKWDFDFPTDKDLFIKDGNEITNILKYDWELLKALRKII